jgi:acyl carrier protein
MTHTNRQSIETKFVEILSEILFYLPDGYIIETISEDKTFDDLGSDDLDNAVILIYCEEEFNIEIDLYGEELGHCSIKDFIEIIYSKMSL